MRTPANAARAWALAATLDETLYRRWPAFHAILVDNYGGYAASTLHGGGRGGGDVSDPTGRQATNPRSDPARFDHGESLRGLQHAGLLFANLDAQLARTLGVAPSAGPLPREVRTTAEAHQCLDVIDYVIDRRRGQWKAYHDAAGPTLDRHTAYADLSDALELLGTIYDTQCRWLGGDPVRIRCQNAKGCPDGNPPRLDSHRCWACGKFLTRYGEERTRAAERAVDGLAEPEPGDGSPEAPEGVLCEGVAS